MAGVQIGGPLAPVSLSSSSESASTTFQKHNGKVYKKIIINSKFLIKNNFADDLGLKELTGTQYFFSYLITSHSKSTYFLSHHICLNYGRHPSFGQPLRYYLLELSPKIPAGVPDTFQHHLIVNPHLKSSPLFVPAISGRNPTHYSRRLRHAHHYTMSMYLVPYIPRCYSPLLSRSTHLSLRNTFRRLAACALEGLRGAGLPWGPGISCELGIGTGTAAMVDSLMEVSQSKRM